jgi:hypothetical protein
MHEKYNPGRMRRLRSMARYTALSYDRLLSRKPLIRQYGVQKIWERAKKEWTEFMKEWEEVQQGEREMPDEVDKLAHLSISPAYDYIDLIKMASRDAYENLPIATQKRIRELMWKYYAMGEQEVEKLVLENEKQEQKEVVERAARADEVKVERSKGMLENLILETKSQLHSSMSKESDAENATLSSRNKEAVQKVAISKLETLEELIREFNDSYHTSKNTAVEEILSKPDYIETMKASLVKALGQDPATKDDENANTSVSSETHAAANNQEISSDKKQ